MTLFEKTKPIFAYFGLKTKIPIKNKANSKPFLFRRSAAKMDCLAPSPVGGVLLSVFVIK
jgi:hypothetical protein